MVKNPPANARDTTDLGSVLGSGRFRKVGSSNHSSILAWKIPWTEEPGSLQSMGLQSQTQLSTHILSNLAESHFN